MAAGKSALARRLATLGARVVDVDRLGHEALATPEVKQAVVATFGRGVLLGESGALDRRALAQLAFRDDASRLRLEAIVHPVVRVRIDEEIAAARATGAPLVVLDCALLFESGLDAACDATVDVDASPATRVARAKAAHGWDEAEVRRREAAQLPASEKRARADRVVVNEGNEERLAEEARTLVNWVRSGAFARERAGRRT